VAEGRADEAVAERVAAHLAECRSCMAAYADAVRYRSAWLAAPRAFTPSATMMREGASVAEPGARRSRVHSQWLVPAVGIAVLVAAVGFAVWRLQPSESTVLRAALERESSRGLVLPGGERGADREPQVQRGPAVDAELGAAVSHAAHRYEAGDRSAAVAYDVAAGYLLIRNLDAARDYAAEGLKAHPDDQSLAILAAVLAYRNSDLERAEGALRDVLRRSPNEPVATLDLAIVMGERGVHDEARALLEALIAHEPRSPLARRAGRILGPSGRN
jgi:tetratricopeptide (TPR) repeat protein